MQQLFLLVNEAAKRSNKHDSLASFRHGRFRHVMLGSLKQRRWHSLVGLKRHNCGIPSAQRRKRGGTRSSPPWWFRSNSTSHAAACRWKHSRLSLVATTEWRTDCSRFSLLDTTVQLECAIAIEQKQWQWATSWTKPHRPAKPNSRNMPWSSGLICIFWGTFCILLVRSASRQNRQCSILATANS